LIGLFPDDSLGSWPRNGTALPLIAVCQLFGIWALGPVWMLMSASFSGGGFTQAVAWRSIGTLFLFFPVCTPMMATYDGSLAALGLTTLTLPVVAFLIEARQRAN
jgi:hypothetical protein